jgi:hypothetical protein
LATAKDRAEGLLRVIDDEGVISELKADLIVKKGSVQDLRNEIDWSEGQSKAMQRENEKCILDEVRKMPKIQHDRSKRALISDSGIRLISNSSLT